MSQEKEKITIGEIIEQYNSAQEYALRLNYLVRDPDLQIKHCNELEILKNEIKQYKCQAISRKAAAEANLLFHFQCMLNSFISVLQMWTLLKNQDYEKAWRKLVDAQEYVSVAIRGQEEHLGINQYIGVLYNIEKTIFPQPSYLSPAFLTKIGKCSICNIPFSECEHIEGLIYMGRLCRRINIEMIKANHIALVDQPRDKRCIIRYISTKDGKKKDNITWKVFEEKFGSGDPNVLQCQGVFLKLGDLDFD